MWKKYETGREKAVKYKKKGRKRKERDKMGSKRIKYMQNREEIRQKGHDRSRKTMCCERGKKYSLSRILLNRRPGTNTF